MRFPLSSLIILALTNAEQMLETGNEPTSTSFPHINNLLKELERTGGYINKIEVQEIWAGNNGFIATEDITIGDTVLFVPEDMMMSEEKAQK